MTICSSLYVGSVMHRRLQPRMHRFRYRAFWLLLDLDELEELSSSLRWFSHNRPNIFSFYDADHGDGTETSLRVQIQRQLSDAGVDRAARRIRLLCMPRTLGYCFNPISIFFCYAADGALAALVYQVHNTFGERHSYVIRVEGQSAALRQHCQKHFYVSPFLDMDMRYDFRVTGPDERIAVGISASSSARPVLNAVLTGTRRELTDRHLMFVFLKIPAITLKVIAAIHWEALRLWAKGIRLHRRPSPPAHAATIVAANSAVSDLTVMSTQHQDAITRSINPELSRSSRSCAEAILRRFMGDLERGELVIEMPAGNRLVIGGRRPGSQAKVTIHSWRCLWRLVSGWDIGFAEAYCAGELSSPDLVAVLRLACANRAIASPPQVLRAPRVWLQLRHAMNRNTRRGSRRNISAHYDLGNEFYQQWLDAGMSYSAGLFSSGGETLEQAQNAKLDRVLGLLELTGGERVLELGCGWGALAERLVQNRCNLTAITLSSEQLAYARRRLSGRAPAKQYDLRLQDYRDVRGNFDRIVSIEMLEAVGEAYWPTYFKKLHDRLRLGGIAVLQVITIDEARFENYRRRTDFIQRYIFPGGMLPTPEIIRREASKAGLHLVSNEFFGEDYARTLEEWRGRFQNAWPQINALGFDLRFKKMWDYYLAYCQVGFEAGAITVGLYKFKRAASLNRRGLDTKRTLLSGPHHAAKQAKPFGDNRQPVARGLALG